MIGNKIMIGKTRNIIMISILLLLNSCGFSPLYSSKDLDTKVAQIQISPIDGALGQAMRNNLEHLFNPNNIKEEKKYTLKIELKEKEVSQQGITQDDIATRITVSLTAKYKLLKDNKVILSDNSMSLGSYNILNNPYSSYVAKKNILKQLNDFISNDIALRVSLFIKDYKNSDTDKDSDKEVGNEQIKN